MREHTRRGHMHAAHAGQHTAAEAQQLIVEERVLGLVRRELVRVHLRDNGREHTAALDYGAARGRGSELARARERGRGWGEGAGGARA